MAAKIGILGESTLITSALDTTVYTVPASKAARVRILFAVEGGAGMTALSIRIGPPGGASGENVINRLVANDNDVFSGMTGAGSIASNTVGVVEGSAILDMDADSTTDHIIAPFPHDYFLSTGDLVAFTISGGDAVDVMIQVQGVEDDA